MTENIKLGLENYARTLIRMCKEYDEEIRHYNLQDEQFFLNWQDDLNNISVK